jgi:hypothetical protein
LGDFSIRSDPAYRRSSHCDDGNAMGDLDIVSDAKVTLVALEPGVTIKQTCAGERVIDQRGRGMLTLKGVGVGPEARSYRASNWRSSRAAASRRERRDARRRQGLR